MRAYTKDGQLIGFYPATIGSEEKPAHTGTFKVRRVAWNPDYHYDPSWIYHGHPGNNSEVCDDQDFACRTARVQMKFARRRENPCDPDKNREAGRQSRWRCWEAAEEVA